MSQFENKNMGGNFERDPEMNGEPTELFHEGDAVVTCIRSRQMRVLESGELELGQATRKELHRYQPCQH